MMPPDKATSGGTARFPGPMYAGYGWKAPMFSVAAPASMPILRPSPVLPW